MVAARRSRFDESPSAILFRLGMLVLFACPAGRANEPIEAQIQGAAAAGSAEFVVPAGVHLVESGIRLRDVRGFALRGLPGAILQLPPAAFAVCGRDAAAGAREIDIVRSRALRPGMQLEIAAPGAVHSFTGKPAPNFTARLERPEDARLVLAGPLPFPVPKGTLVRDAAAPNLIRVLGGRDIVIENLILDGGRRQDDPRIQGHALLCGIFAEGPYTYEKGPTGPPIGNLVVRNCTIRNCFGRGVAFYSVADGTVEGCTIEDCIDEAIDFDHFAVRCRAIGNRVARCRIGIEMNDAYDCAVTGNDFAECGTGLNLWRWCRQPGLNCGNLIASNAFSRAAGDAIRLATGTARNIVRANTIAAPRGCGISVSGAEQVIEDNRITGAAGREIAVKEGDHVIRNNTIENSHTPSKP